MFVLARVDVNRISHPLANRPPGSFSSWNRSDSFSLRRQNSNRGSLRAFSTSAASRYRSDWDLRSGLHRWLFVRGWLGGIQYRRPRDPFDLCETRSGSRMFLRGHSPRARSLARKEGGVWTILEINGTKLLHCCAMIDISKSWNCLNQVGLVISKRSRDCHNHASFKLSSFATTISSRERAISLIYIHSALWIWKNVLKNYFGLKSNPIDGSSTEQQ